MSTHDEENVFRADCCVAKLSRNRFGGLLHSNSAHVSLVCDFPITKGNFIMKIKRLTAALAVAAMAAGFTLASPMLSANAANVRWAGMQAPDTTYSVPGGTTTSIPIWTALLADPIASTTPLFIPDLVSTVNTTHSVQDVNSNWMSTASDFITWSCTNQTAPTIQQVTGTAVQNLGSVKCGPNGTLVYTPNPAMGVMGDFQVYITYTLVAVASAGWTNGPALDSLPGIWGRILVTVGQYQATNSCTYDAKCLTGDVQAYAKKAKAPSVKVELLAPNALRPDGTGFVEGTGIWGLGAINFPDSNDKTLSTATLMSAISFAIGPNSSSVTFIPPAPNWSGTVTYQYVLASYAKGVADTDNLKTGLLTFTVHPTLTAQDPIVSDQGIAVSVPVLSQPPIGSGAFSHASCVFANSKNKTTLTDVGSISNKNSKDPVFTPTADFVGSIDLSCTVQDVWGTTSNTITVTIQVGAAAPVVPVAPTASPACGNGCNDGKLVSTGGSLAAPMSSGLAAVVLLVAAGAGILVVRRRTSLAG